MLLQGFILRETKLGKLKCINPQGKMLTTSTTYDIRYTIEGTTKLIPENMMLQVNEIFKEIGSNGKLSKIACDIKKREGLDRDVGHFISYWIQFNKHYSSKTIRDKKKRTEQEWNKMYECQKINDYIDCLDDKAIGSLIERNDTLFKSLSECEIKKYLKNGEEVNISEKLKKAIEDGKKEDTVKEATSCVYQIRNRLVHSNEQIFKDLRKPTNFVFELIYVEQIKENTFIKFYADL